MDVVGVIGIVIGLAGLVIGVLGFFSPRLHERFDAFQFHRKGGLSVAGEYYSVFSNPAVTKSVPVTWEEGVTTQRGAKVNYKCRQNDYDFQYEMNGTLHGDIVVGYWLSKLPNERVHGSAYLYVTPRGDLVGFWAGDAKPYQKTSGYWALSKKKEFLECFVQEMHTKQRFRMIDVLACLDDRKA